jgi:hypothetical protein
MTFARQYGADRIWIVNVGHLKAYPFPMQYFLDLAWYGDSLTSENIREYTKNWVIQQFGTDDADETADIMALYTRFNGRRKPELLSPETYSLVNYHEAETVVSDYHQLVSRAEKIYNRLPVEKKDAFYQLVLFPVKASALVNSLYLAAAKNNLYAQQCRASANGYAEEVQQLFSADTSLMAYYNKVLAGGKWNHFMDQPHLGYISWRDPAVNNLQHISLKNIEVPEMADMGVSIQGSVESWPGNNGQAELPEFDIFNNQTHFIEIFNKGSKPFEFEISADPWILLSESTGMVGDDKRIHVRVNWNAVPEGKNQGIVYVKGTGKTVEVRVEAFKPVVEGVNGFTESNGCVSMEAEHYTKNTPAGDSKWIRVEDFGHTLSGMRATSVPGVKPLIAGENAPCLEYRMYLFTAGEAELISYVSPTLNFLPGRSVNYAISVDDQTPKVVTIVPANFDARNGNRDWEKTVSDNYRKVSSKVMIDKPGQHTLKIWMVDPGVVLQKIVLDMGGVKPSYLGPPESVRK